MKAVPLLKRSAKATLKSSALREQSRKNRKKSRQDRADKFRWCRLLKAHKGVLRCQPKSLSEQTPSLKASPLNRGLKQPLSADRPRRF